MVFGNEMELEGDIKLKLNVRIKLKEFLRQNSSGS